MAVAAGDGLVLQQAVAAFVAHRAIEGVVHHQPLDDVPAELHGLGVGGGDHHAVTGVFHAAHLDALHRPLQELDGAHAAGAEGAQAGVVAEPGDHDPQPFGGGDDLGPGRDLDGAVIDDELGHNITVGANLVFAPAGEPEVRPYGSFDSGGYHNWHCGR